MYEKIENYVSTHSLDLFVDYDDSLSDEQVNKILEGKADEVRDEIVENANEYIQDDYLESYWSELKEATGATQEELDKWLEEDGFYPCYDLDDYGWSKLISNTDVCITATVWDAEWNFNNWAYGGPVNYSDVKEALKILDVNPFEFKRLRVGGSMSGGDKLRGYFPDMQKREPKVHVPDLWNNMIVLYDGVLNFCLGDLEQVMEVIASNSKDITFKKGTNIVMYDFGNGAGITETELTADLTIPRKKVEFRNDLDNKYGIQECYGFVNSYWKEGGVRNGK